MGKCNYYLVKTDDLSVEAENVECSGSISEVRQFFCKLGKNHNHFKGNGIQISAQSFLHQNHHHKTQRLSHSIEATP
jgi:hypothetical protein